VALLDAARSDATANSARIRNVAASSLTAEPLPWQDQYMQPEVIVGLMSAGVGALAIAASTFTTYRSLEVQRDNTRATLETQRALADMQERALRDRSQEEELRDQQAPLYAYLIRWTYNLLEALDQITAEHSELPKSLWHIEPTMEDSLDLYSSDGVQIHSTRYEGY
jgi:hypothetical protein